MVCQPNGVPKYCATCRIFRPERTSHCAERGRCVAKFDHFCPLLSSAIGIGNYKYYINCLLHSFLLVIYLFVMSVMAVIKIERNAWTVATLVLSSYMFLYVFSVFGVHIYLILNNVTTKENNLCHSLSNSTGKSEKKAKLNVRCNVPNFRENYQICGALTDVADLPPIVVELDLNIKPWKRSCWENWKGVMGEKWWRWFFPLSVQLEQEVWWACEFNERIQNLLRVKGKEILKLKQADEVNECNDVDEMAKEINKHIQVE